MVPIKNMFDTIHETSERHTLNDKYENFVTTHLEAAAECIPTGPKVKSWVPKESTAVKEKWDLRKASLLNYRNPTNANVQKLKPKEN